MSIGLGVEVYVTKGWNLDSQLDRPMLPGCDLISDLFWRYLTGQYLAVLLGIYVGCRGAQATSLLI